LSETGLDTGTRAVFPECSGQILYVFLQTTASEATFISLLAGRTTAIQRYKEIDQGLEDAEINSRLVAYCSDQVTTKTNIKHVLLLCLLFGSAFFTLFVHTARAFVMFTSLECNVYTFIYTHHMFLLSLHLENAMFTLSFTHTTCFCYFYVSRV
jgi:hypothetical protein